MFEDIFPGNTEMARRMRALDWSKTSLGPVEQWPEALRTSVSTCLNCAFPIIIWWGADLAILYNDEYCDFLGPAKHPAALGQPGAIVWAEIWDIIHPMLSQVMQRAEATRSRDLLLHIDREGYLEEAYFSFSYSPIYNESGKVGGVFCPVIETTDKVIGERRLRTLRDLAAKCKGAESESSAYDSAASVLAENPYDVPFAMIYRIDEGQSAAHLEATAGILAGSGAAPWSVVLHADAPGIWSLAAVAHSGSPALVTNLSSHFDALPAGGWKISAHSALVLPVLLPGQERPRAILVAGVSPMRALNEDYRTFFGLVATQIASGLADAQALEEERRRAEALAEIDRAKTAFFSNVSHEFRTPLTLMLAPLEDALAHAHGVFPNDLAASISVAHRNSLRLLKLVNTLLDFSRIEAGRVEAKYEPIDLAALTAELASVFRSATEKAGLRLLVDCPPLPEPAYIDRDMWEKVVLNLLSNAFKFTFDGDISVGLRARGERFELTISDTGVGIPAADLPKIFQRFHRVKNARSRTHEGSGIGLALVQELVRLHSGEVTVQSQEGSGTTFIVSIPKGWSHLPAERISSAPRSALKVVGATPFIEEALRWLPAADEEGSVLSGGVVEALSDAALALSGSRTRGQARVLLVDDNADMRDYLRRLLDRNYEVATVADGQAALERIQADPPDLVVTDVMMPLLDGFGLIAAIRADERTRTLPVIMLSARAGEESRIEGLAGGADDYLIKPFSARELLARVGSQLELARLRRESQQAIRFRGEQFKTLLDQAPLGVYLIDADFRIREVNRIAVSAFGDIPGGVVGRDFAEIIFTLLEKQHADEIVRIFRRTLENGVPYIDPESAKLRIDRGGITEYYEWRVDRIILPDGRYGLVCYFREISAHVLARKAIEESREALKEADRRKDEFLATLAHELRNPLAPVRNAVGLLKHAMLSTQDFQLARDIIDHQIDHMVRLIDDLLDVSRISRGKIELKKKRVTLQSIVDQAIETSRPHIEENHHNLTVTLPGEGVYLDADPVRLAQVLSNLINNACKYSEQNGAITINAEIDLLKAAAREKIDGSPKPQSERIAQAENQRPPSGSAEVVISVKDSGIGIARKDLSRLFEMFSQVGSAMNRSQGGLGIGLSLVRALVELHGGSIEARSEGLGKGSEFVVRLPMAEGHLLPQEISLQHPALKALSAVRRKRVLVVDDNVLQAKTLAMLLELKGFDARIVYDGSSALELLSEFTPEVALIDIGLPDMTGYELAQRLRALPELDGMLLIAQTGWGRNEDREHAKQAGFDFHLIKPIEEQSLEKLLNSEAVGRRHGSLARSGV